MSNQFLKLRRSAVPGKIPDTASLDFGEIALNTHDGLAFMKKSGSSGEEIIIIGSTSGSFTGSFLGTASYAISSSYALIPGQEYYVPVWDSTNNSLTSSIIFQSASFTAINYSGSPEDPNNTDLLYIHGVGIDTHNLISAHSDKNSYVQINVQNYNNSTQASSDIVATADNGTENINYIDMGINSSGYDINSGVVGGQNDAYLYSTGNNLLIGNASVGRQIILFNGGLDAQANARVYIHDQGTVGINTSTYNPLFPPALEVQSINQSTTNLIHAYGSTDNYLQFSITNANIGTTASADIVAYNDIDPGNQQAGYVDLGINSTNYVDNGVYPGKSGDAYLFSDSSHLILGVISGSIEDKVTIFAGGVNELTNAKLTLFGNNRHQMTGSLNVSNGITASLYGTASWAQNTLTASYFLTSSVTSASYALTASSAVFAASALTASYFVTQSVTNATSASYAATASSADSFLVQNNLTASNALITNTITAQTLVVQTITSSREYSSGSNVFGSQITDTQQFTGSVTMTGSLNVTGRATLNNLTGSLFGTASWAQNSLTASYFLTQSVTSASYALSSSFALTASYVANASSFPYTGSAQITGSLGVTGSISVSGSSGTLFTANVDTLTLTGSLITTGSIQLTGSMSVTSGGITSSLFGTASWAQNSLTASYFVTQSVSSSTTASYAFVAASGTGSFTGSFIGVHSGSFSGSFTGSFIGTASQAVSASYALTASSAVFATSALTASYFVTQSVTSASYALTASSATFAASALTASYFVTQSVSSASYSSYAVSSSYVLSSSYSSTASYVITSSISTTSSYALTASYLNPLKQDVQLTGSLLLTQSHISTVDWIDFTIDPGTPTHLEGRAHWNVDRKTLQLDTDVNNFMIPVGHTNVLRGRNTNSYTLTKGTVVYIKGNSGQFATFGTASWDDESSSAYTIGIIPQDIASNNYGYAVTSGEITGVNTNGYAPATLLYLSSSGQYTSTKPVAPKQEVRLGQVVVSSTNGSIQVKVDNGYEIEELHNVLITSSSYGDLLVKDGNGLWINSKQLTGSYAITGSLSLNNWLELQAGKDPGGSNTSSSYFFNTSSTDDTVNNLQYRNHGKQWEMHWLEERTDTGIVWGGVTTYSGSTIYITPGAGLIVNHNASTSSHGDTVPTYVQFGPITASATYITSSQLSYLIIDSNGSLLQQTTPFTSQQYNEKFPLGYITHLTTSSINNFADARVTTYGQSEQDAQFIRAFGPLKISGYDVSPQTGSLRISVASGQSYRYGGFYSQTPDTPSVYTSTAVSTGSIVRLYRDPAAVGGFVAATNAGLPYTVIDPTKYDNGSGTLQAVSSSEWTIQRAFQGIVNGVTYIYYGQNKYSSLATAVQSITTEAFVESSATQIALPFIGYIIVKGDTTDIGDIINNRIIQSGLFRNTAGSSGGGGAASQNLDDLADVVITSADNGQALIYNAGLWVNGTPSSASYALTSSFSANAATASYFVTQSVTSASYALTASSAIRSTTALTASYFVTQSVTSASIATTASYITSSNVYGPYGSNSILSSSFALTASYVANASSFPFTGSAIISGSLVVTGSVDSTGGFTGSLLGTASYATQAATASYFITSSVTSASYALTASSATFAASALTASYFVTQSVSSSTTASYAFVAASGTGSFTGSFIGIYSGSFSGSYTGSYTGSFFGQHFGTGSLSGSFSGSLLGTASYVTTAATASYFITSSVTSASYALTASSAVFATSALTASYFVTQSVSSSTTSSYSLTASYLNPLNQTVIVTGSVYISGSNSSLILGNGTASAEAGLVIGAPPSGVSAGEGGQIILQASNISGYTSASMLDNYQNKLRVLRGNNTSSDAFKLQLDMHTGQLQLPNYNSSTAFVGTAAANLAVDSSGNVLTVSTSGGIVFPYTGLATISGSLQVTGSAGITGSLTVSQGITGSSFTGSFYGQYFGTGSLSGSFSGSLLGTASYVTTAATASYFITSSVTSASYALTASSAVFATSALTASYFVTQSVTSASYALTASSATFAASALTASYFVTQSVTSASYALTASYALNAGGGVGFPYTGSAQITGSLGVTGSISIISGSLLGTASWANNSLTASYFVTQSVTSASYALTASSATFAASALTASYFLTQSVTSASYALTASSAVFATSALTASYFVTQSVTSASYALTASSATFAASALTASYFVTQSVTSASYALTASSAVFATSALTASYFVTQSVTSASYASYAATASSADSFLVRNNLTASNALITSTITAQTLVVQTVTSSIIYSSGSNTFGSQSVDSQQFTGSVTITGSLNVNGPATINNLTGSLFGTASYATQAATASYFITSSVTSASYALTASSATFAASALTASYFVTQSVSSSTTASYAFVASSGTGSFTGSFIGVHSGSFSGSFTGSFIGTGSYATYALNAGSASVKIADEGTLQGSALMLDFVGSGVTATVANNTASISISGGGAGSITVADEGTAQGTATFLNFIGASVTAAVSSNTASISILTGNINGANAILSQSVANVTWSFTHSLDTKYPVFTIYDSNNDVIVPQRINVVDSSSALIYFSTARSGTAVASKGGFALSASYTDSSSLASTASYVTSSNVYGPFGSNSVLSSSFALTASYVANASSFPYTGSARITGSLGVTGSISIISGSLLGTSSYAQSALSSSYALSSSFALTASYVAGAGLTTKSGVVTAGTFTGNPKKATVTFSTAFATTNYGITVTGEDARTWTIESKLAGSFVINANSNTALTANTYWHAIAYGESS